MALEGSLWVQGTQLRYTGQNGSNYAIEGTYISNPSGAIAGSFWVEGASFGYIDQYGAKRLVSGYAQATISNAIQGSIWVEGNYFYWINTSQQKVYGHGDQAHSDNTYSDSSYYDYSNSSSPHGDSTVTFQDSPSHHDYVPYHADWPSSHNDGMNYNDTHANSYHNDTPHADYPIGV